MKITITKATQGHRSEKFGESESGLWVEYKAEHESGPVEGSVFVVGRPNGITELMIRDAVRKNVLGRIRERQEIDFLASLVGKTFEV